VATPLESPLYFGWVRGSHNMIQVGMLITFNLFLKGVCHESEI